LLSIVLLVLQFFLLINYPCIHFSLTHLSQQARLLSRIFPFTFSLRRSSGLLATIYSPWHFFSSFFSESPTAVLFRATERSSFLSLGRRLNRISPLGLNCLVDSAILPFVIPFCLPAPEHLSPRRNYSLPSWPHFNPSLIFSFSSRSFCLLFLC